MKALVTGGAGFIGSHLAERLVQDGHRVIVLDNLATGRLDNLSSIKDNPALTFVEADVADLARITGCFEGIDWVFHLAALADIVPSIVEPYKYHRTNVDGTVAVLEAAKTCGVKKFVYAASSSCYGIPQAYPTPEGQKCAPDYPYAFTKYIAEAYCIFWAKIYKIPVISLRLFNVYGPRSRSSGAYGAVLGVFLAQKLAGAPFTIVGDGAQKRDFVYVSDVADAFVRAADSEVFNEVFNVGTGQPQSVNSLASLIDKDNPCVHIPKRPGEPECTWADITKIKKMLGWSPRISFEEGVKRVVANIQFWKDAPLWTPEKIQEATKSWFSYLSQ